jgi:catechol 2,3-dioxygenase-like lactoylglutathione lyase family enzyme
MGLESCKVEAIVAVTDMDKAKEFYEGKLGLPGGPEQADGGITYRCAGGTEIHIYPSPDNAGKSGATLAAWATEDVEGVVNELTTKGVQFEQYDMDPIKTDERGIADIGGDQIAWFKDPDGNILAVGSPQRR